MSLGLGLLAVTLAVALSVAFAVGEDDASSSSDPWRPYGPSQVRMRQQLLRFRALEDGLFEHCGVTANMVVAAPEAVTSAAVVHHISGVVIIRSLSSHCLITIIMIHDLRR